MNQQLVVRAPGKCILLGEYAVLEGAPAIVQAVNSIAEVVVRFSDRAAAGLNIVVSAEQKQQLRTSSDGLAQVPLLNLVAGYLQQLGLLAVPLDRLTEIQLNTGDFFSHGEKLGLGSSAALTLCLTTALAEPMSRELVLHHAVNCHRQFQGGQGSGADLACSLYGGLIGFQSFQGRMSVESLVLPEDLFLGYVWSGVPASTSGYLNRLQKWRSGARATYDCLMGQLTELAIQGVNSLRQGSPEAFMMAAARYDRALMELSQSSGTGFYSQVHRRLGDRVRSAGGVYKPSGAGGGDFGLYVTGTRKKLDNISRLLADDGYVTDLVSCREDGLSRKRKKYDG